MASNQKRRTVEDPHSLKHDRGQLYIDNSPRPKRPKVHEKMQGLPTINGSNGLKGDPDSIEATDFYELPTKTNETCTSLRSADRRKSHKTALKERSPSPERWSEVNRDWANDWHKSVVYPKTGKKTATVDKQDIYRLDNGEFLNDNLIMFYLLWLEQHHPELTERVYVHNTFFYASLTKTAKGKRGINYEAVERWTAKVDLPSYDYIIVPVNENTHWYVAIICNAPKLLDPDTKEESPSLKNGAKPDLGSVIESHNASKPTTPSKSPQPTSERLSNEVDETDVDDSLKGLSLMNSDGDETQTPLDVQPVKHIPPSNHGLPTVSSDDDSDNVTASKFATKVIDLAQSSSPLANPDSAVKDKKSLPNRAYDPKQPRIITLDSLAQKHPSTCGNLKDYMVAEIRAKKQISITPPKTLGMTAKTQAKDDQTGLYPGTGLPLQGNYCDCGVYLLSYMEEFFERPDSFIEDIVENKYKVQSNRNDTPEFRVKIRNILFKLQAEQALESEVAKKARKAKKSKAAPLMPGNKVERPNPQTASLSISIGGRKQPASNPSVSNLGNNDNLPGVAGISPDPLPNLKRKEVINIEDSQNDSQEQIGEESASNRVNDTNYRAIEDEPKSRGSDRETRQAARTPIESGSSERRVHLEIRDSFEEQESTQESANNRSTLQQHLKRKSPILDLDGDESHMDDDLPGENSREIGTLVDNAYGSIKQAFRATTKHSVGPAASKDEGPERNSACKPRKQDVFEPSLESPSRSGSNSPRPLENYARLRQDPRDLRSPPPEQIGSSHSRSRRMNSNGSNHKSLKIRQGNVNQVDLTKDEPDEMLLEEKSPSFPDVSTFTHSPLAAASRKRHRSNNHVPAETPLDRKTAEMRRGDEDKAPRRFRHAGVEVFASQQLTGRDPAEAKMIAQSKH